MATLRPLHSLVLALALGLSPVASAADRVELRLRPWVDGPLTTSTLTFALVTFLDESPPWVMQAPQGEPSLGFDQPWAGLPEIDGEGPALLSDMVGLYPSFAMPVAMGAIGALAPADGAGERARRGGTWLVVGTQAIAVNTSLTNVVKYAVRRPRPYTYSEEWQAEQAEAIAAGESVEADAQFSFYSGHTSSAGAWTFCLAHSLAITHDWPWYGRALPYLGAAGLTTWTGVLRVRAHKHFPSDVLVGGLAGATVGILVPELHRSDRVALATGATVDGTPTVGISAAW